MGTVTKPVDQQKNQNKPIDGFDLENAPIRRPLTAEALARRVANKQVEEIEDPDEE